MDTSASCPTVSGLLSEYDENLARVGELADDTVFNSHVSFLSLLNGDLTSKVVWKIMYLLHRLANIDERCTMLSIISDYICNSSTLLETSKSHSPSRMIQVLAESWLNILPQAKKFLDDSSFETFNLTLARCTLSLTPYNLHRQFKDILKLSLRLRDPDCDLTTVTHAMPPVFPHHARISHKTMMMIIAARNMPTTSAFRTTAAQSAMPAHLPANSSVQSTATKTAAHTVNSPARQTTATPIRHDATTPPLPIAITPARHLVATSVRHDVTTPTRTTTTTPARPAPSTPAHYNVNTPVRQNITTPARQVSSPGAYSMSTGLLSSPSLPPSARRLIYAELERLHVIRSSPAMPLHTTPSSPNTSYVKISSTNHASSPVPREASTRLGSKSPAGDLSQSVNSQNTSNSRHPRPVMKELYFNPE